LNAQGSRIIVVVQIRANKIYVIALKEKERHDGIQFTTKIDGFFTFTLVTLIYQN
jgi:hypothetical protein